MCSHNQGTVTEAGVEYSPLSIKHDASTAAPRAGPGDWHVAVDGAGRADIGQLEALLTTQSQATRADYFSLVDVHGASLAFDAAVGHLDLEAAHALLRALAAVLVARSPAVPLAPDAVDRAPIPNKICCATCRSARFFFARV